MCIVCLYFVVETLERHTLLSKLKYDLAIILHNGSRLIIIIIQSKVLVRYLKKSAH